MTEVTIDRDTTTFLEDPKPAQEVAIATPMEVAGITIPEGPGALLAVTAQLIVKGGDPNTVKVMLDQQFRVEDRQAERSFAAALAAAQSEIPQVSRLGIVDLTKKGETPKPGEKRSYSFTRLEDIDLVLRPIMDKHGFSISFDREQREGGGLVVTGTLSHREGHRRTASFPVPLDTGPGRSNIQAMGSSDTYAKRYIIEGFFNIVRKGKDNDGTTAEPLLQEEITDIMELLSRTRTSVVGFIKTMISGIEWNGDPDDPDYRPDPVMLLEQVQRVDYERMHKALASKLRTMKKKGTDEDDAP